jgi:hypothetical protein
VLQGFARVEEDEEVRLNFPYANTAAYAVIDLVPWKTFL